MTETGKVTKIDGSFVTVSCKPFPACHSCGSRLCGTRGRDIVARNPHGIKLEPGDYAQLSLPASQMVGPALRVFGLPVSAFILAYAASAYVPGAAQNIQVLAGLAGCLLGALAAFLLGRRRNACPEVVQTVPAPADADKPEDCPESYEQG